MFKYEQMKGFYKIEELFEWRKWTKEIPFIKFPASWSIKPMPPFGGAVARFRVMRGEDGPVSIYLDCYEQIGSYEEPYWEVCPFDGDVGRCPMADTKELVRMIGGGLREIKGKT